MVSKRLSLELLAIWLAKGDDLSKVQGCDVDGEIGGCDDLCRYRYYGLTFDLGGLRRPEHYSISLRDGSYDTQYAFGVCRNIDPPSESCLSTRGSARNELMTNAAAAYQILRGGEECFRCGSANDTSWGLVNEMKPAEGVWLRFDGGNTCDNAASPTLSRPCTDIVNGHTYCRRSLTVKFICDDHTYSVPTLSDQVREEAGCAYTIVLNSQYGCPTQCPRADNLVCAGHGVCAYDGIYAGRNSQGQEGRVGCNCDQGWSGPACDTIAYDDGFHYTVFVYRKDNFILALGLITMFIGFSSLAFACRGRLLVFLSGLNYLARNSTQRRGDVYEARTSLEINTSHGRYQTEDIGLDTDSSNPFLAGGNRFVVNETVGKAVNTKSNKAHSSRQAERQAPAPPTKARDESSSSEGMLISMDEPPLLAADCTIRSYDPNDPLGGLTSP